MNDNLCVLNPNFLHDNNYYKYDSFIKLDIKSYYKSIDHDLLKKKLKRKIRKKEIIDLIFLAITTPSISLPIKLSYL